MKEFRDGPLADEMMGEAWPAVQPGADPVLYGYAELRPNDPGRGPQPADLRAGLYRRALRPRRHGQHPGLVPFAGGLGQSPDGRPRRLQLRHCPLEQGRADPAVLCLARRAAPALEGAHRACHGRLPARGRQHPHHLRGHFRRVPRHADADDGGNGLPVPRPRRCLRRRPPCAHSGVAGDFRRAGAAGLLARGAAVAPPPRRAVPVRPEGGGRLGQSRRTGRAGGSRWNAPCRYPDCRPKWTIRSAASRSVSRAFR